MDYLNIGGTPVEETCAGPSDPARMRLECRVFKEQLQRLFPEGDFRVKGFPHDFGTYYEVVAYYNDEATTKAAFDAEAHTPANWDDEALEVLGLHERAALCAKLPSTNSARENARPLRASIEKKHAEALTEDEIASMICDSVCEAADGCEVEPDGVCQHGYRSPLLVLGVI
jgi:hypothetical protein